MHKHVKAMQRRRSKLTARDRSGELAAEITHFHQTAYPAWMREEVVPKSVDWFKDELTGYKYEDAFRQRYAQFLLNWWLRRQQKEVVQTAMHSAINTISRHLEISKRYARNLLIEELPFAMLKTKKDDEEIAL
jgi:hypothetical protein